MVYEIDGEEGGKTIEERRKRRLGFLLGKGKVKELEGVDVSFFFLGA